MPSCFPGQVGEPSLEETLGFENRHWRNGDECAVDGGVMVRCPSESGVDSRLWVPFSRPRGWEGRPAEARGAVDVNSSSNSCAQFDEFLQNNLRLNAETHFSSNCTKRPVQ